MLQRVAPDFLLDDFSRYIVAWRLGPTNVCLRRHRHARPGARSLRPRPYRRHATTSASERQWIKLRRGRSGHVARGKDMRHVRGAPYHPQTQGKIERWHQTLKNRILLDNYYLPGDLERQIGAFVEYYNHVRYH
jgi:putative transposase